MTSGSGEVWAAIAGALLTLLGALVALPKIRAEARKANAEADGTIEARLLREIRRLDTEMKELRTELASVKATADDEKRTLKHENQALHSEVARLTRRVEGLESILRVTPLPNDMKVLLEELNRKTAKRGRS